MNNFYQEPKVTISTFSNEDVIKTSLPPAGTPDTNDGTLGDNF